MLTYDNQNGGASPLLSMPKKRYNFTLSAEAHEKLRKLAGIASMSAYLEKLIKEAK